MNKPVCFFVAAIVTLFTTKEAWAETGSPCAFFVKTAGISGTWLTVEGRAEILHQGKRFTATFFDNSTDSHPSHIFVGSTHANHVSAYLENQNGDAGKDFLSGRYVKQSDPYSGSQPKVFESLIAHNETVAVGITCYTNQAQF